MTLATYKTRQDLSSLSVFFQIPAAWHFMLQLHGNICSSTRFPVLYHISMTTVCSAWIPFPLFSTERTTPKAQSRRDPLLPGTGLPRATAGKSPLAKAGGVRSIPGEGRSPGEGSGNPLQSCCLGNSMDRGAWRAIVNGVIKSRTRWAHTQPCTLPETMPVSM